MSGSSVVQEIAGKLEDAKFVEKDRINFNTDFLVFTVYCVYSNRFQVSAVSAFQRINMSQS